MFSIQCRNGHIIGHWGPLQIGSFDLLTWLIFLDKACLFSDKTGYFRLLKSFKLNLSLKDESLQSLKIFRKGILDSEYTSQIGIPPSILSYGSFLIPTGVERC